MANQGAWGPSGFGVLISPRSRLSPRSSAPGILTSLGTWGGAGGIGEILAKKKPREGRKK